MAAVILRPGACVHDRAHPFRYRRNPNPNTIKPKPHNDLLGSRRRKRSPLGFQSNHRKRPESMVAKSPGKDLVMGEVKILKRGEKLNATATATAAEMIDQSLKVEEELDLALGSTNRLGPDPETMQKQIKLGEVKIGEELFAGAFFFFSPPPSSVPVPGFLARTAKASA